MEGPAPDGTYIRAIYVVWPEHWELVENMFAAKGIALAKIPSDDDIPAYCLTPIDPLKED